MWLQIRFEMWEDFWLCIDVRRCLFFLRWLFGWEDARTKLLARFLLSVTCGARRRVYLTSCTDSNRRTTSTAMFLYFMSTGFFRHVFRCSSRWLFMLTGVFRHVFRCSSRWLFMLTSVFRHVFHCSSRWLFMLTSVFSSSIVCLSFTALSFFFLIPLFCPSLSHTAITTRLFSTNCPLQELSEIQHIKSLLHTSTTAMLSSYRFCTLSVFIIYTANSWHCLT